MRSKIALLQLMLLSGCATINLPTAEIIMRQSYNLGCVDEVNSVMRILTEEESAKVREKIEECLERSKIFDLHKTGVYRSDYELITD
jgi:hypothetical protein